MSCEFRVQAARLPPNSAEIVRCPVCRRTDWFRDGLTLVRGDDGALLGDRVEPARARPDDWSCMGCGYEVPAAGTVSRLLARIAMAARWSDVNVG